ncbi:MAG: hypothetical protein AB7I30_00690 [Isosphaeraceae bacterium]
MILLALIGTGRDCRAGGPPSSPEAPQASVIGTATDRAINLFLKTPDDLDAIWKTLARPDFVLIRGEEYERLKQAVPERGAPRRAQIPGAVISGVKIRGNVEGDLADVVVETTLVLESDDPTWVPIGLDGLTLTGSREGDRELPIRAVDGGGWEVESRGRGPHRISTALVAPVRSTAEGRRLEIPIPEAARTGLDIGIPQRVSEASTGLGEPIASQRVEEDGRTTTRLQAEVAPRAKLAVIWKIEEEAASSLAPLLVAQGEIALEVDSGSLRTRSSWAIRSLRGSTRSLQFRLDPEEEVREIELDGQTPPAGIERAGGATLMTIPLVEPLGPGQERRLVMTTRRAIPVGPLARLTFNGFPLTDAREQAGAIGISRGSQLWVSATAGRGVRQIDPRTELPVELRSRPGTELAFQFSEQPFELNLKIEPSLPLVTAQSRTTVSLDRSFARIETWLDYQTTRGRLFELSLGVPPGLDVESVGPEDVVKSWQSGPLQDAFPLRGLNTGLGLMTVRVTPRVQDAGRFSLQIVSRQRSDPSKPVSIGLVQPLGVLAGGGRLAVLAEPSLGVELAEDGRPAPDLGPFRTAALAPPADWPWPGGRTPIGPPELWLRFDESPSALPLRITVHPMELSHSTSLVARLDRQGADVTQDVDCAIRFGTTGQVDVSVPQALQGRWEIESPSGVSRAVLGPVANGQSVTRLSLPTELTRSVRLRFRYRIPYDAPLLPNASTRLSIPWIGIVGSSGAVAPLRATLLVEPGISPHLDREGSGWSQVATAPTDAWTTPDQLSFSAAEPVAGSLDLHLTATELAKLPALVVPRLWIRSVVASEGRQLSTAAFAVESNEPWFTVALPPGAELLRARIDGTPVTRVERLPRGAGLRVRLGERTVGSPTIVEFEYVIPGTATTRGWDGPRVLGDALIQQTFWEVVVPPGHAVVGVPSGWTDENEWDRQGVFLRRNSHLSVKELADWLSGGESSTAVNSIADSETPRLLFGRPEGNAALPILIASRTWLVATCSGAVMVLGGFFLLIWRPTTRLAWVATSLFGLTVAAVVHPSVILLALQSGLIGVVLTVVIALMQRRVERRQATSPGIAELGASPSGLGAASSTFQRPGLENSDDSTAIRSRPVSTIDYARRAPSSPANGNSDEAAPTGSWPKDLAPPGGP